MEKEIEIYCDKCGCSTAGEFCQICESTEDRIEIIPLTPKKLQDYLNKYPNKPE